MHKKNRKELSDLYFVFFKKHLTNGLRCAIICKYSRVPAVLAQLDRVPGYEPVGRGFESLTPCQKSPRTKFGEIFTFSLFTFHFSLNPSEEIFGKVISNSE